jgi:hypothetical protein
MKNKNIFYVYKHVRKDDGVIFYIGKGKGKRAWKHESRNLHWQRTVDKHGYDVVMIAENINEKQSLELEVKMIAFYGRNDIGKGLLTNMTDGGDGVSGYVYTNEQRKERSERMFLKGDNNPAKSEESRKKISDTLTGKSRVDMLGVNNVLFGTSAYNIWLEEGGKDYADKRLIETNNKKSISMRGNKQSEEHILKRTSKIKGSNNGMYNKPSPNRKKVIDNISGQIFNSLTEASVFYKINVNQLSSYLNGKRTNKTNLRYM